MAIHRFHDPEDARRALWTSSDDPGLPGRMRRLWSFALRLSRPVPPRGVRRYRSIEEAQADRASWPRRSPDR
jgi:hypothetical protein